MSTCLISGGAGFLGSHMCDHLLAAGSRVICVDNLDTGSLQNVEHIRDDNFTFVQHDLTEPFFTDERIDVTVDLATLDAYKARLAVWKAGFADLAAKRRASYVDLSSDVDLYGFGSMRMLIMRGLEEHDLG